MIALLLLSGSTDQDCDGIATDCDDGDAYSDGDSDYDAGFAYGADAGNDCNSGAYLSAERQKPGHGGAVVLARWRGRWLLARLRGGRLPRSVTTTATGTDCDDGDGVAFPASFPRCPSQGTMLGTMALG